jgi:hypothetical protein
MIEECQARPSWWSRWRFHVLVATLIVLTVVLLGVLELVEENATEAKFSKINPEMTVEEVQDVLGPPSSPSRIAGIGGVRVMTWNLSGRIVQVFFDSNGRVMSKEWGDGHVKPSLKDRIRGWLGKLGL